MITLTWSRVLFTLINSSHCRQIKLSNYSHTHSAIKLRWIEVVAILLQDSYTTCNRINPRLDIVLLITSQDRKVTRRKPLRNSEVFVTQLTASLCVFRARILIPQEHFNWEKGSKTKRKDNDDKSEIINNAAH